MLARRSQYHQEILINYTTPGNPNFQNSVSGLAQNLARAGLGAQEAHNQAYARIYQLVQVQAATLAYVDTFKVLAVASAIMFLLAFTLKRNEPGRGADLAVG
jgi:DHA2 family multidrug resistance protein